MNPVKVAIRVHPLISREKSAKVYWTYDTHEIKSEGCKDPYIFDRVFGSDEETRDVYNEIVEPIVKEAMEGFNGTVLAYGQTSSGKTYTMMGRPAGHNPGIIPMAIRDTFSHIQKTPEREFLLRVSYLEIYNEVLKDLLVPASDTTPLQIREDELGNVVVQGLRKQLVSSEADVLDLIRQGDERIQTDVTNINERSSRSHTVFSMILESHERVDVNTTKDSVTCDTAVKISQLNLVDLAGSERADQTGAEGQHFKEGCHINKSISVLGLVIDQICKASENSQGSAHISFRDSKLTRILQPSLGGNALTAIICVVTLVSYDDTDSTLRFASKAKLVNNKARVNEMFSEKVLLNERQSDTSRETGPPGLKSGLAVSPKLDSSKRQLTATNQSTLLNPDHDLSDVEFAPCIKRSRFSDDPVTTHFPPGRELEKIHGNEVSIIPRGQVQDPEKMTAKIKSLQWPVDVKKQTCQKWEEANQVLAEENKKLEAEVVMVLQAEVDKLKAIFEQEKMTRTKNGAEQRSLWQQSDLRRERIVELGKQLNEVRGLLAMKTEKFMTHAEARGQEKASLERKVEEVRPRLKELSREIAAFKEKSEELPKKGSYEATEKTRISLEEAESREAENLKSFESLQDRLGHATNSLKKHTEAVAEAEENLAAVTSHLRSKSDELSAKCAFVKELPEKMELFSQSVDKMREKIGEGDLEIEKKDAKPSEFKDTISRSKEELEKYEARLKLLTGEEQVLDNKIPALESGSKTEDLEKETSYRILPEQFEEATQERDTLQSRVCELEVSSDVEGEMRCNPDCEKVESQQCRDLKDDVAKKEREIERLTRELDAVRAQTTNQKVSVSNPGMNVSMSIDQEMVDRLYDEISELKLQLEEKNDVIEGLGIIARHCQDDDELTSLRREVVDLKLCIEQMVRDAGEKDQRSVFEDQSNIKVEDQSQICEHQKKDSLSSDIKVKDQSQIFEHLKKDSLSSDIKVNQSDYTALAEENRELQEKVAELREILRNNEIFCGKLLENADPAAFEELKTLRKQKAADEERISELATLLRLEENENIRLQEENINLIMRLSETDLEFKAKLNVSEAENKRLVELCRNFEAAFHSYEDTYEKLLEKVDAAVIDRESIESLEKELEDCNLAKKRDIAEMNARISDLISKNEELTDKLRKSNESDKESQFEYSVNESDTLIESLRDGMLQEAKDSLDRRINKIDTKEETRREVEKRERMENVKELSVGFARAKEELAVAVAAREVQGACGREGGTGVI